MQMTLEKLIKLGRNVDVIIDMSNQPDPDAHRNKRYEASIAYGYITQDNAHYLILTVRADVSIGADGATINEADARKADRAIHIAGIGELKHLEQHKEQMATMRIKELPTDQRREISQLFDKYGHVSDKLPPHKVHYINADMTNPNHRPHS